MKSFRKTSFSVYLPDGTRCRGAYYPADSRPVGVYVHGFRSSVTHDKARYFLDHALQHGYSWVNFDLPCHGRSEGRFRDFRVSAALTALIEVIHQLRGAPIVLIGASMGAWLSMLAARKLANARGVHIGGAVLIAPAFDFIQHYFAAESDEVMRAWRSDGVRQFIDEYDHQPYQLEYAMVEDGLRHNLLEQPGKYDFPIRIFHGDQDEVAPISLTHRFKEMAAESDIVVQVIEGGDHALDPQLPLIAAEVGRLFHKVRVPEAV